MSLDSGCADAPPASPAAGFSKGQPTILPLPRQWERVGVRVAWKKNLPKTDLRPSPKRNIFVTCLLASHPPRLRPVE
jgi:hypothetical protein